METKWIKPVFLFTVLTVWTVGMSIQLARLSFPDPIFWGVPTSLWLAMYPPSLRAPAQKADEKSGA